MKVSWRGATNAAGASRQRGVNRLPTFSKIEGSLQELEESEYWLKLLAESGFYSSFREPRAGKIWKAKRDLYSLLFRASQFLKRRVIIMRRLS